MKNYSKEKLILYFTATIFVVFIVFLLGLSFYDHKLSSSYISLIITNLLLGRVPSISLGNTLNLAMSSVVMINFITELVLSLFFYTLFLYSLKKTTIFPKLTNKLHMLKEKANEYKSYILKYGVFGLLAFVFMPFWMTGPVVGVILGEIMGFSLFKNLGTVFTGTFVAIYCWAILIEYFIDYIRVFL
jgi:uncharacterized membrane protein